MLFVVMVNVNRVTPDRVADKPATVLSHKDWIILFVVKGSVNVVYAWIIAVKKVTVFHPLFVLVLLILQNVNIVSMIHVQEWFSMMT